MFKKLVLFSLCLCLVFAVGCRKEPARLSVDPGDEPSIPETPVVSEPEVVYAVNPLTGEENLSPEKANKRPLAITINNIEVAQRVQTGVGKADIVYETEVEGGITRLVAVYKDTENIDKIGTVRSARYAFIDLAMGHNAIYVHHGQDSTYAAPHLKDVAHFVVDKNNGGARISNGLASEHTLYAYGDNLWKAIKNAGFNVIDNHNKLWQNFAPENLPVMLSNTANSVTVPFSGSYKTTFKYDATSGKYIRVFNGTERKDYVTGESLYFKNVFVLTTTIRNYSDGYHRQVFLESGDGYYFVNGTYTPIKWSKGAPSSSFKFTNADGSPLPVNPGNSWVCISEKNKAQPVIE